MSLVDLDLYIHGCVFTAIVGALCFWMYAIWTFNGFPTEDPYDEDEEDFW